MDGRAFLQALWGDTPQRAGPFIQVWELAAKRTTYWPAPTDYFDGQHDVFCGVGLAGRKHGPGHRAKATEVVAIAGLWLDIDIGPTACPTRNDAFALSCIIEPPTITIDSGNGLHAWHLFEQPWCFRQRSEQERARIIARQWCALHQIKAAEHGWRIDSVGDLARVLRIPGTLNAKDPASPRPVMALGLDPASGPRYTYSQLARHLSAMPIEPVRTTIAAAPAVPGDATQYEAKLDALRANSPEFDAVWTHQRAPGDGSLSAYDLSLCSLAAGAMNDEELRTLMLEHRRTWGDEFDAREGRPPGSAVAKWHRRAPRDGRLSYIDQTIALARSRSMQTDDAVLRGLTRRAA